MNYDIPSHRATQVAEKGDDENLGQGSFLRFSTTGDIPSDLWDALISEPPQLDGSIGREFVLFLLGWENEPANSRRGSQLLSRS